MEQIKSEIKHKLKVPFKYSTGGSQKDAKELIIKAPNNEVEDEIIAIDEFLGKVDNKGQELIFSKLDMDKIQEYQKKFEKMKLEKQAEKDNLSEDEKIKQVVSSLRTVEGLKTCLTAFSRLKTQLHPHTYYNSVTNSLVTTGIGDILDARTDVKTVCEGGIIVKLKGIFIVVGVSCIG